MKPEDRQLIAQLCAARAGIRVDPEKAYFIESRLGPVARREGFGSIPDMIVALRAKREERLIWAIVETMAFGETSFFRDPEVWRLFRGEVLPTLSRLRDGESVRIWSAACGSGQEIYTIAMIAEEEREHLPGARLELFASDIGERTLEKAQSGLYTQFEVQRGLPIRGLVRHFEKADENWAISPRLRQMIRWRRLNLIAPPQALGQYDVIFCRYMLFGLIEPMRVKVLEHLAACLQPDGFLFLGVGETATGLTDALQPISGRPGLFARNPAFRAAA
jgi:chemotaxis protein methyltransferase CheR